MWTSSTPGATGSAVIWAPSVREHRLFELQRVDPQLLAAQQLQVQAAARAAAQREPGQLALGPAAPAAPGRWDLLHGQLGALERRALRHELERERERRRDDLPQVAHLELDLRDGAPRGMRRGGA